MSDGGVPPGDWRQGSALVFIFVTPVSYVATWLIGIPVVLWLKSSQRLSAFYVNCTALVAGIISGSLFAVWISNAPITVPGLTFASAAGAVLALPVAIVFCWVSAVPLRLER